VASHLVSSSFSTLGSITVFWKCAIFQMPSCLTNAAPRMAGPSELLIQGSVEPDDSSVEFRRHADLREETPLELSW
jgi:hypothetical protein